VGAKNMADIDIEAAKALLRDYWQNQTHQAIARQTLPVSKMGKPFSP